MSAKRKAAVSKGQGNVKVAKCDEDKPQLKKVLSALKKVEKPADRTHQVDKYFPSSSGKVYEDYDCMLNQTNIQANNNKFYLIQVIELDDTYYLWTRWGRVGEVGASKKDGPFSIVKDAIKAFEKKFTDKTKNAWNKRSNFVFHPGKYTFMEIVDNDEEAASIVSRSITAVTEHHTAPSKLDSATQDIIRRIFSADVFKHAMTELNIDVKKMPLGQLSATQITKAFVILDDIDQIIQNKHKGDLDFLSSRFYTLVPHDFGRQRPPTIRTPELLRQKLDMLLVLSDIQLAQALQQIKPEKKPKSDLPPHPLDEHYALLDCELVLVKPNEADYKLISEFMDNTADEYQKKKLINIWRVTRTGERERFKSHEKLENRRLLWHGTNIAVVVAILKSGLRIMPHSGGRVGKGIYFASLFRKSYWYTSGDNSNHCVMFLSEVALGRDHKIFQDHPGLVEPPDGFDSVVAQGLCECDPKDSKRIKLDSKDIIVPFSKPKHLPNISSSFAESEYLIYKESQCCIRFMVEFQKIR